MFRAPFRLFNQLIKLMSVNLVKWASRVIIDPSGWTEVSAAYELAVLPHALVDLARLVDQLAPARPLAVDPVAQVVVAIRVDVPTVAVIDVILELALVDDVVDFFAHTLHSSVWSNLPDDEFVESALAKLEALVDRLARVRNDILQLEWSQFCPLFLDSLEGGSRLIIVITADAAIVALVHVRRLLVSGIFVIIGQVEWSLRFQNVRGSLLRFWLKWHFFRRFKRLMLHRVKVD